MTHAFSNPHTLVTYVPAGQGKSLGGKSKSLEILALLRFCVEIPTGGTERAPEPLPETFCDVSENRQNDKEAALITNTYAGSKCLGTMEEPTVMDLVFPAVFRELPKLTATQQEQLIGKA